MIKIVRENTDIPSAIGFGISTPEQARAMSKLADGVIVGSAIIKILDRYGRDAAPRVGEFAWQMKGAIVSD